MPVPSSITDLDSTIANNSPSGSDAIGTTLDDYLRAHAGIIRQVSDAKISAGAITSSGLTVSAADKILGRSSSGSGAVEEITCTSAGRAILDDASAADQRTTLGLGTAATKDTGTSAGNVVVLDGSAKLPAVDGSQLTNLNALTSSNFTGSNVSIATSGYQKLPSGIIIQWGVTGSNTANGTSTWSFPIAFPTACLTMSGCGTTANTGATDGNAQACVAISASQFQVISSDAGYSFGWIAIGY